jgi:predicted nucleotidyltransferase/biotin operon repressor
VDLGHPLASIAPRVAARVIEVLAGTTQALSGREIARISGESRASVWRSLEKLTEAGLVVRDDRSAATYYVANRDHLAWPAIERLAGLRPSLIDRIREDLEGWRVAPLHASLFGSFARGDAGLGSDIDLLLVRPPGVDDTPWDSQVEDLRARVLAWTGNRLQPFVVDPGRLSEHLRAGDPLVTAWLTDGIFLAGQPLRGLMTSVASVEAHA